jgi:hypothetical protein
VSLFGALPLALIAMALQIDDDYYRNTFLIGYCTENVLRDFVIGTFSSESILDPASQQHFIDLLKHIQ